MPAKRKLPLEFVEVDAKEDKPNSNLHTEARKSKFEVKCEEKKLEKNEKKEALANESKYKLSYIFQA